MCKIKKDGNSFVIGDGLSSKIKITPENDGNILVTFGKRGMDKFSLSARIRNPYYIEKLCNNEIDFTKGFYKDYFNEKYLGLSTHQVRTRCHKVLSVGLDDYEEFSYFELNMTCGVNDDIFFFECNQFEYDDFPRYTISPVVNCMVELNKKIEKVVISTSTLEDIVYNYAIDCYDFRCQFEWFNYRGVEFNGIFYHIPYGLSQRLCWHDNLRKLDFVNTGKMINLSDEEVKKYEGHVAKCVMFGVENKAELFIKQDGTCIMIY